MNLVSHIEIPVTDLNRAMGFYGTLFGISFEDPVNIHGNRMAFFPFDDNANGASGALCEGEPYKPTQDGAIIYFAVPDIDETLARAISLGAEIIFPKTEVNDTMFVAEVSDSEGNRIALQSV